MIQTRDIGNDRIDPRFQKEQESHSSHFRIQLVYYRTETADETNCDMAREGLDVTHVTTNLSTIFIHFHYATLAILRH